MEQKQHPTGPTVDTLKAAEALQKAGFTGAQARAVTQTVVAAQANLATKADIRELRAEIKGEFKTLRTEVESLGKIVSTMLKVIMGVTVPLLGVIFAAVVGLAVDYFFLSR